MDEPEILVKEVTLSTLTTLTPDPTITSKYGNGEEGVEREREEEEEEEEEGEEEEEEEEEGGGVALLLGILTPLSQSYLYTSDPPSCSSSKKLRPRTAVAISSNFVTVTPSSLSIISRYL
jgi:hypothetical protein